MYYRGWTPKGKAVLVYGTHYEHRVYSIFPPSIIDFKHVNPILMVGIYQKKIY